MAKNITVDYSDDDISRMEDEFITGKKKLPAGYKTHAYSHYKEVFAAFKTGRVVKWNWTNFLFGSFHLLYRKQYLWGFLSLAATFAFVKFPPYLFIQALVFGLFGDFLLYQKFCSICDDGVNKYNADKKTVSVLMKKKGGTNTLISVLIAIAAIIALVIVALIVWGVGSLASWIGGFIN